MNPSLGNHQATEVEPLHCSLSPIPPPPPQPLASITFCLKKKKKASLKARSGGASFRKCEGINHHYHHQEIWEVSVTCKITACACMK